MGERGSLFRPGNCLEMAENGRGCDDCLLAGADGFFPEGGGGEVCLEVGSSGRVCGEKGGLRDADVALAVVASQGIDVGDREECLSL